MTTLNACEPHFIRCIKSNNRKTHSTFDGDLVLRQLRYLGLRDVVYIRQQGFPVRRTHADFLSRYHVLTSTIPQCTSKSPAEQCALILNSVDPTQSSWRNGKTKVFYRMQLVSQLENSRDALLVKFVTQLQAAVRCKLEREKFIRRRTVIQKLEQSLVSQDLSSLEQAIDAAGALGGINKDLIRQAVSLRNRLLEQQEARKALESATKSKDKSLLELAIQAAKAAQLAETDPALAAATTMCNTLIALEKQTNEAMTSRRLSLVEKAIKEAQRLGIKHVLSKLEPLKVRLGEEKKIQDGLQEALNANDVGQLRKALEVAISAKSGSGSVVGTTLLERAKAVGIEKDPLVAKALAQESTLTKEVHAFQVAGELQSAIKSDDLTVLRSTVAMALDKGFKAHAFVAQAQARIKELEALAKIKTDLVAAMKGGKRDMIAKALETARLGGATGMGEYVEALKRLKAIDEKQAEMKRNAEASATTKAVTKDQVERKAGGAVEPGINRGASVPPPPPSGDDALPPPPPDDDDLPPPPPDSDFVVGEEEGDPSALVELTGMLEAAKEAGLDDEVASLQARLDAAAERQECRQLLQAAVASSNAKMLGHVLSRAEKAGIPDTHSDVVAARKLERQLIDKQVWFYSLQRSFVFG